MSVYKKFVFLSAGPIGDHAIFVDYASRFYESTGIPSTIIYKHYFPFLSPITKPYPEITNLEWESPRGKLSVLWLAISSIWQRNLFILVLPLRHPTYLKVFARFIRFCTRSRFVGFNLKGSISFREEGSAEFLGPQNIIPSNLDTELFYEQANRMLAWLGFKPVARVPVLRYVEDAHVLTRYRLTEKDYLVIHIMSSDADRSLPEDRWQQILLSLVGRMQTGGRSGKIVLTGSKGDDAFIQKCLAGVPQDRIVNLAGKVGMTGMLHVYAKARAVLTVHTGNAMLINMLHVPTVVLNIRGVYMFNYKFNPNAFILTSPIGCTCDPYERGCTMVEYHGRQFYPCVFNVTNEEVVAATLEKYNR